MQFKDSETKMKNKRDSGRKFGGAKNSSSSNNQQDDSNENFNNDPDKKDSIPLLIIDVNIRPGVKKKIYVFDGDTADGLSERFSKEHSNRLI